MTRMQAGAEDAPTRVAAAVAGAVVLGGLLLTTGPRVLRSVEARD